MQSLIFAHDGGYKISDKEYKDGLKAINNHNYGQKKK